MRKEQDNWSTISRHRLSRAVFSFIIIKKTWTNFQLVSRVVEKLPKPNMLRYSKTPKQFILVVFYFARTVDSRQLEPSLTRTSRQLEPESISRFLHTFTVILPSVTRTLGNSNLLFPFISFLFNFTLDNWNHAISAWQVGKKTVYWSPKHWIYFKTTE